MSLATKYSPAEVEEKWYRQWMEGGYFSAKPNPDKEPFTIVIPPPNVTGVLHMGHMLNNTIQDVLVRKARMEGREACWVPGTDHASIATEARVVAMLREKGIKKSDLSREDFLKYAWEWKEKYGGIILEQLKKLGASCDWDRTAFTMDPEYYKSVIRVFVDLHKKGYIYRGLRMVNWDCEAKTTISNEEVMYKEDGEKSVLYSLRYKIKETADEWVVIATQRPETILGDTAIAVNPKDERYKHLMGKKALVPFINRAIPIIADDYVDMAFGTGCLKVTPAHDVNDYEIGLRHKLDVIDTINDDGSLNEKCELPKFFGKDRFWVRKEIIKDLREAGHLVKEEDFITRIGRSERTNSVVEPKLSLQWFIKMKEISVRAKDAVENDEIKLHPAKFKNTYRHWMENVRDWCISRQLWWGHRIPAWYDAEGNYVVAESEEEANSLYEEKFPVASSALRVSGLKLKQDSDVLDTWASSWLWPIEVFHGFRDEYFDKASGKIKVEGVTRNSQPETRNPKLATRNAELNYFYPTQVLVTAPEILFFWVARMIIAGYEYMGEKPFEDVYLTGIVRDKQGRKMSKSLGNSPDPLDLIKQYGADGVRTGMLFSSPAGNDLLFDEKLCEQGRNFANKIWNAFRLVKGWTASPHPLTPEGGTAIAQPQENKVAIEWFESKMNQSLIELEDHFSKFRISDALMTVYKLTWDDFCAWYLEIIKPEFGKPIDATTYNRTITFFESLLKMLHPFMPFISEELWHELKERDKKDCLIVAEWPKVGMVNSEIIKESELAFQVVTEIRNTRNAKGISPKEALTLNVKNKEEAAIKTSWPVVKKLSNLTEIKSLVGGDTNQGSGVDTNQGSATGFLVGNMEFFIPLIGMIDTAKEKEAILKDIEYQKGFLASVEKKLSNEKFVNSAPPAVIENERKKKADAEAKIKSLEESLKNLK
jgi:valyl-tRNA synthetase